jgi:hypothetical protein
VVPRGGDGADARAAPVRGGGSGAAPAAGGVGRRTSRAPVVPKSKAKLRAKSKPRGKPKPMRKPKERDGEEEQAAAPTAQSRAWPARRSRGAPGPAQELAVSAGSVGQEAGEVANALDTDTDLEADAKVPWWRQAANHGNRGRPQGRPPPTAVPAHFDAFMRDFISAITWACVTDDCGASKLLDDHTVDQSSRGGTLYAAVANMLGILDGARNAGAWAANWSPDLVAALERRPVVTWAPVEYDPAFQQFAGCEVCLRVCSATRYLWLCGAPYESQSFWPEACSFTIASAEDLPSGAVRVVVKLLDPRKGPDVLRRPAAAGPADLVALDVGPHGADEYWADNVCMLRCTFYHELTHAVARVSSEVRQIIVRELEKDDLHLPPVPGGASSEGGGGGAAAHAARLEEYLVDAVVGDDDFTQRTADWFRAVYSCGVSCLGPPAERRLGAARLAQTDEHHLCDSERELQFDDAQSSFVDRVTVRCQHRDAAAPVAA